MNKKYNFNNFIFLKIVKLFDLNLNYLGFFKINDSILKSKILKLDLVELKIKNNISICKILNYNKLKYLENKSFKNSDCKILDFKKIKEIKFRLFISENDYKNKFRFIKNFLSKKFKLKITIIIKGREIIKTFIIREKVNKIIFDASKFGVLINNPNYSNRIIHLYFNPK